MKTSFTKKAIFIIAVFFLGAGLFLYTSRPKNQQTACAPEKKFCSDGSSTGRNGPDCEFAACPKENLIRVESPKANETVLSPLTIKGEARGFWFFEASFPIRLYDANGKELVIQIAQAKSEWMTENFVPFEAVLWFSPPETKTGTLVLEKDNPSGLPKNADELKIPVRF